MPTLNDLFTLDGRVAIVTGGSRGLGQEMAERKHELKAEFGLLGAEMVAATSQAGRHRNTGQETTAK